MMAAVPQNLVAVWAVLAAHIFVFRNLWHSLHRDLEIDSWMGDRVGWGMIDCVGPSRMELGSDDLYCKMVMLKLAKVGMEL